MIPTLPLRLRNRLAEVVLAALRDPGARRTLTELGERPDAAGWLEPAEAGLAARLGERARRAAAAVASLPFAPSEDDLRAALDAAATLFDAGLYFEVHELLEPHWIAATGETRETLQGLIQIAVGWQHLANGNPLGARSLFVEGSGRLHARRLAGADFDGLARAAAAGAERVAAGEHPTPPAFPRRGTS